MKTVKIKYVDFWPNFSYDKDPVYGVLKEKYNVEISDSPDYIIYSTFGKKHLNYDCIKIFYAGEEQSPDFNICDYGIGFDFIDFGDRYFRLPLIYHPMYRKDYDRMINRGLGECRKKFCSFVYSNPQASPIRGEFFEKLSAYEKVDSGGKFMNNVGGPVPNKYDFEKNYRFSIAFENVSHPGYSTEKLMQSFAAGGIPIYWGDPLIEKVFNPKSFINVMNFSNVDEAIQYIKSINENEELYNAILNEKALNEGYTVEIVWKQFEKFILNIFEQDINRAQRTTRIFWNLKYQTLAKNQEKLYQLMAPVRGIRYRILKLLHKRE